ncbi:phosphotransferase [Polaribacter vadi]|uniref:phosphotransferase n=1 Tax=Polaribacter vadi TaxID=1774273 RepID=UPI0030EC1ED1|tara:strand:+ start:7727 stop:10063 length:2337 start_codon:yes stop_codon:yes gene_type:complete
MENYPIVPGRGLVTPFSTKLRLEHLKKEDYDVSQVALSGLSHTNVQNKIESYIGSVEIPVGLVGPLLHLENDNEELVYAGVATLEGALVASMNRGAKATSLSGGIKTTFVHQKMVRCPMFIFYTLEDAVSFIDWLPSYFKNIKKEAEQHSNYAQLEEIETVIIKNVVHTRFYYTTGDASGQNMTTTCTWHAMLFIVNQFTKETAIRIKNYVIEGNGSSDKKISTKAFKKGRGIHIIVECYLKEAIIIKVLRTTSDKLLECFLPSIELAKKDGMFGYNINVANAIAAIFAATGQDLGCLHESSAGILNLTKKKDGILFELTLPNLVIGTIGGGTSLLKQNEMLRLMNCDGNGKVQRFAKLIAAFTLSLEISTFAAIVSGEFAKAHEKLGRNRPVNLLTKFELNTEFIIQIMAKVDSKYKDFSIHFDEKEIENGIITNLINRKSNKTIGFFPFQAKSEQESITLIIKSKALDIDVIKGLHSLAASIDPSLSDLIYRYRHQTEYFNCHSKELFIYEDLNKNNFYITPKYYGKKEDLNRELFLFIMEYLDANKMSHFNSENKPELWKTSDINKIIIEITKVHKYYHSKIYKIEDSIIQEFKVSKATKLYQKLIAIIVDEEDDIIRKNQFIKLNDFLSDIKDFSKNTTIPLCVIHNDFNPRNAGIRSNGNICVYDWELAVKNIPHRDIVEFLAFTFGKKIDNNNLKNYLELHTRLWQRELTDAKWMSGYIYALKEFLVCRMSFYKAAEIIMKLKFPDRVIYNCFLMIDYIEQEYNLSSKNNYK